MLFATAEICLRDVRVEEAKLFQGHTLLVLPFVPSMPRKSEDLKMKTLVA